MTSRRQLKDKLVELYERGKISLEYLNEMLQYIDGEELC